MSTQYQSSRDVPSAVLAKRLDELAEAVSNRRDRIGDEFTMRIPAECDRDADLVMAEAASRLRSMSGLVEALEGMLKLAKMDGIRPHQLMANATRGLSAHREQQGGCQ